MKFLYAFIVFMSWGTQAWAARPVRFPPQLTCHAVGNCVAGYPNFCDPAGYFPVTLVNPEVYATEAFDPSGVLSDAELQGLVKLDYSEGDQYSFYFFEAQALTDLADGKLSRLPGTYEDGFDWTNGYNTRAKFRIECTRDDASVVNQLVR